MRRCPLSLCVILLTMHTSGCASSRPSQPPHLPNPAPTSVALATPIGGAPILQLVLHTYGGLLRAADLPDVAIYADGTVVSTTWSNYPPPATPTLFRGAVPAGRLASVIGLARAAQLDRDESTFIASGEQIVDGGASQFVTQLDGHVSSIWADQLGNIAVHRFEPQRWAALEALQNSMVELIASTTSPVNGDWMIRIRPMPSEVAKDRAQWIGPSFTSIDQPWGIGNSRCAVFAEPVARKALLSLATDTAFADNGEPARVWVRPLLPHEHTCADATAGNAELLAPKWPTNAS
jgi:hypothetical protein